MSQLANTELASSVLAAVANCYCCLFHLSVSDLLSLPAIVGSHPHCPLSSRPSVSLSPHPPPGKETWSLERIQEGGGAGGGWGGDTAVCGNVCIFNYVCV